MARIWKLVALLLVAGGLLVSCGGDDDDLADAAAASADADADEGDDDDSDLGDFAFGSEECREAMGAFAAAAGGAAALFGGGGDELRESLGALDELGNEVPEEIAADFEIFVDAYTELIDILGEIEFDPASGEQPSEEQMAALEEMGERFDDAELERAAQNVEAWFEENCELDSAG